MFLMLMCPCILSFNNEYKKWMGHLHLVMPKQSLLPFKQDKLNMHKGLAQKVLGSGMCRALLAVKYHTRLKSGGCQKTLSGGASTALPLHPTPSP